jgi:hypothetical protein
MGALAMPQPGSADPLEALRWEKRAFVVFAHDKAAAARQLAALPTRGLVERDMVVLLVSGEGTVRASGAAMDETPSPEALRRQFEVAPDVPFVALLVGKDGGVKVRETAPISAAALFGLIDGMPMRQQEMRSQ